MIYNVHAGGVFRLLLIVTVGSMVTALMAQIGEDVSKRYVCIGHMASMFLVSFCICGCSVIVSPKSCTEVQLKKERIK